MGSPLVRSGDRSLRDATRVGHKFARQERLRRAGFPVPELVCVPVAVFDAVTRDLPPPPTAPGTPGPATPDGPAAPGPAEIERALHAWAQAAAEQISRAPLPAGLADDLRSAAAALVGRDGLVAVRACVVADAEGAGEDGGTDPFAGLTESFLYVPVAGVPDRVRECWASGLSPRSIRYRWRRGVPPAAARVAVGIQPMIRGTRSFVAFSRDPRTGAASCVIAAAYGIGEGVVQEKADVDHYFVQRATGEIAAEVAVKTTMVDQPEPGRPPCVVSVPAELADRPVLTDDQVRQVSELVTTVERYFGEPQDIEGTITADGTLRLLQARPVTAIRDRIWWSNHNLTESFSGVSGALTYSQAREFYRLIFRDGYRRMGVPARRLRDREHHLRRMIGLLDGRVYYRLDAWLSLHGQIPGFPLVRQTWQRAMGLTLPHPPASRREKLRALLALPSTAVRLARLPFQVRRFLRWWDALVDGAGDLDRLSPQELIAWYRRLWAQVGVWWGITLVNSFLALGWTTLVTALLRRWTTGDQQRLLGGLLTGGRENRSVRGVRSAIALAELVRADPDLAARVRRCGAPGDTAGEIWRDVTAGAYGEEVAAAATTHLRRYGDRALHDLKLEEPSPRQRPEMVVSMIQPMVTAGLTVAGSLAREQASFAEAERELRESCRGPLRRAVIRGLAVGMRWFVRVREDTRYCRSQLFGLTRQVMWRLGESLAAAGKLDAASDVHDLTVEEVLGAYDGTLVDTDLREVARRRREQRESAAGRPGLDPELSTPAGTPVADALPAPPRPVTDPSASASQAPQGADELRGLPSSRGVVRAPARVVLDPAVPPESCRDRIIVAKETDPGWLFLMMAASGMVVERGTLLSHTAITGRLLGIPTVVAVPGATSRIRDGALIEVDGGTGQVRLLPGPPASEPAAGS